MIAKEELVLLLQYRIVNKLKSLTKGEFDETEVATVWELATWLFDSGMVTEGTMFAPLPIPEPPPL